MMQTTSPDQASTKYFSTNNILGGMSGNCMSDTITWNQTGCNGNTLLASPTDPSGRCVSITNLSSSQFSSQIGNRYSSV